MIHYALIPVFGNLCGYPCANMYVRNRPKYGVLVYNDKSFSGKRALFNISNICKNCFERHMNEGGCVVVTTRYYLKIFNKLKNKNGTLIKNNLLTTEYIENILKNEEDNS